MADRRRSTRIRERGLPEITEDPRDLSTIALEDRYSNLKVVELKKLLKNRGATSSGLKANLVSYL